MKRFCLEERLKSPNLCIIYMCLLSSLLLSSNCIKAYSSSSVSKTNALEGESFAFQDGTSKNTSNNTSVPTINESKKLLLPKLPSRNYDDPLEKKDQNDFGASSSYVKTIRSPVSDDGLQSAATSLSLSFKKIVDLELAGKTATVIIND